MVSLFVVFVGTCLAIGSWAALFMLVMSRRSQQFGILAEEEIRVKRYGEPDLALMARVPRCFLSC